MVDGSSREVDEPSARPVETLAQFPFLARQQSAALAAELDLEGIDVLEDAASERHVGAVRDLRRGEVAHLVTEVEARVHPLVVDRQPVRTATGPDERDPPPGRHHRLVRERIEVDPGPARHGDGVVVEERDDVTVRQLDGPVAGPRESRLRLERVRHTSIHSGQLAHRRGRVIGRAVVHHEDVQAIRSDVLGQQAANRGADVVGAVARADRGRHGQRGSVAAS